MFSSTLNPNSSAKQPADLNISQISSIGTPLDQSTPAFLFGKRKTASQANYANSPLNSASAPVSDIFAYPSSQGNIPQHVKDSTLASKSVHWSPSLIQSERGLSQSSQPSAPSTPSNIGISSVKSIVSPPSSYSSQAINAPPLRSLRDKIEPAKKVARRNTFAARSTTSSSNGIAGGAGASAKTTETPTLKFGGGGVTNDGGEQNEILNNKEQNQIEKLNGEVDAADTWVTVFGFQPSQISKLLNLFSRHGEVVSHQSPSKGNFVHIRYSCVTHAHQALSRNGTLLDSTTFIGVIPCTNKEVINGSATGIVSRSASMTNRSMSMYQSILENEELNQSILNNTHNHNENVLNSSTINFDANTSLNSSRISVRSGVGMRPLAADQRNNAISSNQKSDGLFNKLWSSIGLQ